MLRILFSFILFNNFNALSAAEFKPYYHEVKAKNGDAISLLISRYKLDEDECVERKFYELNNLSKNSKLESGKKYILPIKIFKYNGKSIRSTLKIESVEKAKEIQKYNEYLLDKGLRHQSFLKNNLLWVPIHFLGCDMDKNEKSEKNELKEKSKKLGKSEKEDDDNAKKKSNDTDSKRNKAIDISDEVKTIELFGSKYSEVNMFDDQLKGQVFYISSGHGGPDPGAMCTDLEHTLCEDEYAYDVALRLARDLIQHGATVHVIISDPNDGIRDEAFLDCDTDEKCGGKEIPYRQLDRLKQNSDQINKLYRKYKDQGVKKQTTVIIHVDSANKEHRQDVFFYHYGNNKNSRQLAYNLKETFERKYEIFQKGRGYKGYVANRGLYLLRHVQSDAVFIELANIRNKSDHIRLMESTNRQALANWLFEGLTGIN